MNEEEKDVELLKTRMERIKKERELFNWEIEVNSVLNLIEKKNKELDKDKRIIELMAGEIRYKEPLKYDTKYEVIEYFTKKAEGDE